MTETHDRVEDLVAQGKSDEAAGQLKLLADRALEAGQVKQASDAYKRALQIDGQDTQALLGLARVCARVELADDAEYLLGQCLSIGPDDADLLNGVASVYIEMGRLDEAILALGRSLKIRPAQEQVVQTLYALREPSQAGPKVIPARIAVFCGADGATFLNDIVSHLRQDHQVRTFSAAQVTNENQREFQELLNWCDIAWLEWATNLAGAVTKASSRAMCHKIVRLHRYEAYLPQIAAINWDMVDRLITVGNPAVVDQLRATLPGIEKRTQMVTIPNGVDLQRYPFTPRQAGKNLAFVANVRMVKNPQFLLQCMHRLCREDPEYRLFIAGRQPDPQLRQYLAHMADKLDIGENIVVNGYVNQMPVWLRDKHYIVSTSLIESQGMGLMEAMACGIKPVIHDFPGAGDIYDTDMLFLTPEDFCRQILDGPYESQRYRDFIEQRYSLEATLEKVDELIASCMQQRQAQGDQTPEVLDTTAPPEGNYHRNVVRFGRTRAVLWDYAGSHISRMMANGQFYESDLLTFLYNRYGRGGTYVDIGAYIGNHSVFFAKLCQADKVVCVEPTPETFKLLCHNIQVNGAENVQPVHAGLADEPGKAVIDVVRASNRGMNRLRQAGGAATGQEVRVITGDSLDVQDVKLLKIDVEGGVCKVLRGFEQTLRRDHPVVVAEVEEEPETLELLAELGYRDVGGFCATETHVFEWNPDR